MPSCDNERPRSVSIPAICAKAPLSTSASSSASTVASRLSKASFTSIIFFELDSTIVGTGRYCNVANAIPPADGGVAAVHTPLCNRSLFSSWGDTFSGRDLLRLRGKRGRVEVVSRDCLRVLNVGETSLLLVGDIAGKSAQLLFLQPLTYTSHTSACNLCCNKYIMYSLTGNFNKAIGYAMFPVSPKLLPTWSLPTTCLQTWLVVAMSTWFLSPPTWTNLVGGHRHFSITVCSSFDLISWILLLREICDEKYVLSTVP